MWHPQSLFFRAHSSAKKEGPGTRLPFGSHCIVETCDLSMPASDMPCLKSPLINFESVFYFLNEELHAQQLLMKAKAKDFLNC